MRPFHSLALAALMVVSLLLEPPVSRPCSGEEPKGNAGSDTQDIAPRLVTICEKAIPLDRALAELTRQSGNPVEDRRRNKDRDVRLALDLNGVPFWKGLEELAMRANLRISLYQPDGKVALVDGPYQQMTLSFSGLFRVAVKQLVAVRNLETGTHTWTLHLEIACEPRFQPLFLETQPQRQVLKASRDVARGAAGPVDREVTLKNLLTGSGRVPVANPLAIEALLRVEAPRQPADRISLLKGSLALVGPTKMLTFTFDDLAPIDPAQPAQVRKETQEGVSVSLRRFKVDPGRWVMDFRLEYPPTGADFESFESWLVNNEVYLENKTTGQRFRENGGIQSGDTSGHQASLAYRFVQTGKLVLGKPADWKLVYRTPGPIVRVAVPFEFKDVPVP